MIHKIDIYSKNKETGKGFLIEDHITITQEDIEYMALEKFKDQHSSTIRDDREYSAQLDKTIID